MSHIKPRCISARRLLWFAFIALSLPVLCPGQTNRPNVPDRIEALADQLLITKSSEKRTDLVAANKELIPTELRRLLIKHGNVLLTAGQYSQAFDVYGVAKFVAEQIGDKEGIATSSLDIGTVYYFQANYVAALEHYRKARELFVEVGNKYEAAKALSGLALIYKEQRKDSEALKAYQRTLKEFESFGDKEEMANTLSSIGSVYYGQGNYAAAADAFLKSSEANSDADNVVRIADALYMQGDYAQASDYYKRSLNALYQKKAAAGIISALTGAANSAYYQGNYDEALDYYQKNLIVQQNQHDQLAVASALKGIGNVYRSRGDFAAALESYLKSLRLAEQLKASTGTTLGSIGLVRALQGDNVQALEYYRKSLAEFEAVANKIDMARVLSLIGNVYYAQGIYDSAVESYRRSLALREEMDDKPGEADLLVGMGTVYLRQRTYSQALNNYQKALLLFESLGSNEAAADVLTRIADAHLQQGDYIQSLEIAERAYVVAKHVESADALWYARLISGKANRELGRTAQAAQCFIEAIAIVESLRARPAASEGRERNSTLPYLAAVDLLVGQNRVVEAFDYAERAKVQMLCDLLRQSNAQSTRGISPAELTEERKLKGVAVSLRLQLEREAQSRTSSEQRRTDLRTRLDKARAAYTEFRKRLFVVHPRVKVERGELASSKLEELRPLIAEKQTALLEYVLTENSLYLFVVTVDQTGNETSNIRRSKSAPSLRLKVYPLNIKTPELVARVTHFDRLLANGDESFSQPARELYDLILKPAEQEISGKTKAIIVPDGILWRLPFEALKPVEDRYLLDQMAISYEPSLCALREMSKPRPQTRRLGTTLLLAFGNPLLSKEFLNRVEVSYKDETIESSSEQEREIQKLKTIHGNKQSLIFAGALATEERLKNDSAQHNILHFAAPAIIDYASPMC